MQQRALSVSVLITRKKTWGEFNGHTAVQASRTHIRLVKRYLSEGMLSPGALHAHDY